MAEFDPMQYLGMGMEWALVAVLAAWGAALPLTAFKSSSR